MLDQTDSSFTLHRDRDGQKPQKKPEEKIERSQYSRFSTKRNGAKPYPATVFGYRLISKDLPMGHLKQLQINFKRTRKVFIY